MGERVREGSGVVRKQQETEIARERTTTDQDETGNLKHADGRTNERGNE